MSLVWEANRRATSELGGQQRTLDTRRDALPRTVADAPSPRLQLARNPQLSRFFVRDLNADPDGWALRDASFDAVICCVRLEDALAAAVLAARR